MSSQRGLARAVAYGADLDDTPVSDYMTEAPVTIEESSPIGGAVVKMNDVGLRHLDCGGRPRDAIGMISMPDVVGLLGLIDRALSLPTGRCSGTIGPDG